MPNPKNSPTPMAKRIINAGIDAIAHFTIKTTIEENRIWTSVTTTGAAL
jgi:hypothetical protein